MSRAVVAMVVVALAGLSWTTPTLAAGGSSQLEPPGSSESLASENKGSNRCYADMLAVIFSSLTSTLKSALDLLGLEVKGPSKRDEYTPHLPVFDDGTSITGAEATKRDNVGGGGDPPVV